MAEKDISQEDRNNIRIRNLLANIERTFLPVNSIIGKYRIIEEIDRGGMAVVYKATQLDLDRVVALKVMPANISINRVFVERFLSEAHAIGQLNHPNIVKIFEVATEGNIYFLAMEYIPGQNLYYYLHYQKPKLAEVLEIVISLTEALSCAHQQKIIHRDLKLNNVIMRDQKAPVLIDFGLAKAMETDEVDRPGITKTGEIMGSPSYMAPERLLGGPVDHRSDICSLGIMLYEMLTFKNPYLDQRNLHQTTMNVMESNPIPPRKLIPWLPLEIEAITLKAMAKDPSQRYQTMGQFKLDLQNYLKGDPVTARPPSVVSKTRRIIKRHWPSISISIIILLFSCLFAFTFYLQYNKEKSHWQPIYNESFVREDLLRNWLFSDSVNSENSIGISNHDLRCEAEELHYALLNKHFNRDIRIECTISANPHDIFNAGFFLSGNCPDSAICFHINKDAIGITGISKPGSQVVLSDNYQGRKLSLYKNNYIIIERINESVSFYVNNQLIIKMSDNFPQLGKGHDKVGFFVNNGSARLTNLHIYRRAVPEVPSPTLIADRFMERGDFEAALDELSNLSVDFASLDIAKEINLKTIECLVRLGKNSEAETMINKYFSITNKEDPQKPHLYFLQSVIFLNKGNQNSADSVIRLISRNYPQSAVNQAIVFDKISDISGLLQSDQIEQAKTEFFEFLYEYRKSVISTELLFNAICDYYEKKHTPDSLISLSKKIIADKNCTESYKSLAKFRLAVATLDKGKTADSKQILDRLITGNAIPEMMQDFLYYMAQISEFDFSLREASLLYRKIHGDSLNSNQLNWIASVNELLIHQAPSDDSLKIRLGNIVDANHPYPDVRLLASYFLGNVDEKSFVKKWNRIYPGNYWYLYYFARKAHIENNDVRAREHLGLLKSKLSRKEWHYFLVIRILSNIDRW